MIFTDFMTNENFLYKLSGTELDDINKSKYDVRIFRDKSTDAFASVVLSENKERLIYFLDYTYHAIYSHIIKNINKWIINFNQNNIGEHIKPMYGMEKIFFVFKG